MSDLVFYQFQNDEAICNLISYSTLESDNSASDDQYQSYKLIQEVSSYSRQYRVSHKNATKGDVLFFNPKNVTIGSVGDQNKILPSFCPIVQKMLILHVNLVFLMDI